MKVTAHMEQNVLKLLSRGVAGRQISRDLNIPETTVRDIKKRAQKTATVKNTVPVSDQITYLDKKQGGLNWREAITAVTQIQKLRNSASWSQQTAQIKVDAHGPIGVLCLGDTHIGAIGTDYNLFTELTDMIINTPNLYVALLGDTAEMAIKLRSVAEVCAQVLDPFMQLEFINSWIEDIKHKVLWCTWGNHESDRNEASAGACPVKNILAKHAPYFSGIGHVELLVGEQTYKIATSHKFQGVTQMDSTAGCKKYLRMEWPEGEVAIQGDCHRTGVSVYNEGHSHRIAISCGTLNVKSGYAQRYFSLTTSSAFPVLALWPDKKQMVPFFSVEQYMDSLVHENS